MFKFIYNTIDDRSLRNHLLWMFLQKRILDIIVAVLALVSLLPVFVVTAIAIKLTSTGPVLYWSRRVGWDAKEFAFPKFRSMYTDADARKQALIDQNDIQSDVKFKMRNDPRVTSVGKLIRRFSIDELPQLWCVLKGDMSLVGPRPPVPSEVAQYTATDKMRLMMIPGITGIWQVSGRSTVGFDDQVRMDLMYMCHYSIKLDIMILFKTVRAVLKGTGAY